MRSRISLRIGALALTAGLAACTAHPERSTLQEFFNASKLLDKTALSHIATVAFDPQASGIVEKFEVAYVRDDNPDTKIVTVSGHVRVPGQSGLVQKTIVLTLKKGALPNDPSARDRWIVTGFIERLGVPVIPPK